MELIDREALSMELADEVLCAYAKADFRLAKALNVFQFLIEEAPTVEERKHGHWIEKHLAGNTTITCSCCKTLVITNSTIFAYCPYCGAKMDGEPE